MLDEVWLSKLSQASNTEVDTCHKLWMTLSRQIETRLSLGYTLDLGQLGVWICQLEKEYIALLEDGERYLIPPKASLSVISLNEGYSPQKLSLTDLSESIASLTEATPQLCEGYLSQIIPLATRLLEAGREVSLPGLGILSPTEEEASGQVIGFSLIASPSLRDSLNKAFCMFSPIKLVCEAAQEGLAVVSVPSLEDLELPKRIEINWTKTSFPPIIPQEVEPAEPLFATTLSGERESKTYAPPIDAQTKALQQGVPPSAIAPSILGRDPQKDEPEEKPHTTEIANKRGKTIWGLLLPGAMLIVTLSYFYFPSSHTSETTSTSQGAKCIPTTSGAEISPGRSHTPIQQKTEASESGDTAKTISLPSPPKEEPSTTPKMPSHTEPLEAISVEQVGAELITLEGGEGLMQISLRKYGHKVFWVYIYEENRSVISNYNNIPRGTRLKLPSARKYGINANDTNSVCRALVLQRALLRVQ